MNPFSQTRIELAHKNTAVFKQNPAVKAILLTGSVAKDLADDSSDIDLILYYDTLPNEAQFEQLRQAAFASGGGFYGGNAEEGFALYQYIDGIRHDFAHGRFTETDQLITDFLAEPDLDEPNKQIVLSGIVAGLPIYGEAIIQTWQETLTHYPPAYGRALIEKHLHFPPIWVLQKMGADRREIIFLTEELLTISKNIFGILCGLNQLYHPGKVKGLAWTVQKMHIAPPDISRRLPALFQLDPDTAVAQAAHLIAETLTLVDIHQPDIDTQPTRNRLNMILRK